MASFHALFTELLEATPLTEWRTQWPSAQQKQKHRSTRSTHKTDKTPYKPPKDAAVGEPETYEKNPRAFFSAPLTCESRTVCQTPAMTNTTSKRYCTEHHHDDSSPAAHYYQVVKEVVFAFTVLDQLATVLAAEVLTPDQEPQAPGMAPTTAASAASSLLSNRTALQSRLQSVTKAFVQHVDKMEREEHALVTDVADTLQRLREPPAQGRLNTAAVASEDESVAGLMQQATTALAPFLCASTVPLPVSPPSDPARWAGHAHFNPLTTNVTRDANKPTVPLFLPTDVEHQMTVYWRLHNEAEARARLHALRNKDASAYAEHVSLLKISALLQVMEKTHDFMKRIGLNIKKRLERAGGGKRSELAKEVGTAAVVPVVTGLTDCTKEMRPTTDAFTAPTSASSSSFSSSSEYQRFKAYVASTNDDFKLVHSIDSFVAGQPPGLQATLLPHQLDGLRFLTSLHTNHINGILADEMGVGKTIQTLAFLLHLKTSLQSLNAPGSDQTSTTTAAAAALLSDDVVRQYMRARPSLTPVSLSSAALASAPQLPPHLVLAPLSVVREWKEACDQFVPDSLRVAVWSDLSDPLTEAPFYDVVLLPIHAVRRLPPEAMRIQFGYIVVDEAHKAVANLHTMTAQCILQLRYWRRLVLTGTPLNSDLQELWSLLHFLNPDVFHAQDSFEEVFRRPFAVYDSREMDLTSEERGLLVLRLHQILRPFMLRRTKKDVDQSLRMTFQTLTCPLTTMQSQLLSLLRAHKRTPHCHHQYEDDESESEGSDDSEDEESTTAPAPQHVSATREGGRMAQADRAARAATRYRLTNSNVSESTAQALCNHALALPFFSQVLHANDMLEQEPARVVAFAAPCGQDAAHEPISVDEPSTQIVEAAREVSGDNNNINSQTHTDDLSQEIEEHPAPLNDADDQPATTPAAETEAVEPQRGAAEMALACSGKFLVLDLLLTRLTMIGRKAVLFTHWLDCLDLLSDYLTGRGWGGALEVLSGSTSEADRKTRVHRFRTDPSCLFFLLSIKAGGCGINLQTAHVVVMLDRDYTTTNEDQALARVYRIGQRHTVRAVYLTTCDPAESRVATRAEAKNKPRQAIIEDGTYQVSRADGGTDDADAEQDDDDINVPAVSSISAGVDGDEDDVEPTEEISSNITTTATTAQIQGTDTSLLATALWTELSKTSRPSPFTSWPSPLAIRQQLQVARQAQPMQVDGSLTQSNTSRAEVALLEEAFASIRTGFVVSHGETAASANDDDDDEDDRRACVVAAHVNDAAWAALHALVSQIDNLVCTEEDVHAHRGEQLLHPYLPPTSQKDFISQWQRELDALSQSMTGPTRSWHNAHEWCRVLLVWVDAADGPLLLQHALHGAIANDITRQDPAYASWCRQQRQRHRDARLALVLSVHPPQTFKEQCWDDGVEDDVAICRRYLRAQAAQRAHKEAAEQARLARRREREAKTAARVRAAAERAEQAEARRLARAQKPKRKATKRAAPPADTESSAAVIDVKRPRRERSPSDPDSVVCTPVKSQQNNSPHSFSATADSLAAGDKEVTPVDAGAADAA